jgi:hypothetical protein
MYTIDGTAPVEAGGTVTRGVLYTQPFQLGVGTVVVRAVAFKSGMADSPEVAVSLTVSSPSVYVGGFHSNHSGGYPCYWRNSQRIDLVSGPLGGQVWDSCLSEGSLYFVGIADSQNQSTPSYWLNGIRTDIPWPGALANGIAVASGRIYVAGYATIASNPSGWYWVDGQFHTLYGPTGTSGTQAEDIFIVGSTLYVAGSYVYGGGHYPCVWVDGTRVDLQIEAYGGEAKEIFVTEDGFYVAGVRFSGTGVTPCLWHNSARLDLPVPQSMPRGYGTSVWVSGSDVYVGGTCENIGSSNTSSACYWKNGTRVDLPGPQAGVSAICVAGGVVYCAGSYGSFDRTACTWIDGQRTDLSGVGGYDAAFSINVQ